MNSRFLSACLFTTFSASVAMAQSAYVYLAQSDEPPYGTYGSQHIYAYSVSADGKLTPVAGSPFTEVNGQMVGDTGSHFITRGYAGDQTGGALPMNSLFSYGIAANGAIGQLESQIDTDSYGGGSSSSALGATLDHSGKSVYVYRSDNSVQTFKLSASGLLTFQGATTDSSASNGYDGVPKLTGNNAFAYSESLTEKQMDGYTTYFDTFNAFARASDGSLQHLGTPEITGPSLPQNYYTSFNIDFPNSPQSFDKYADRQLTNDPSNHLAVMLTLLKFTPPDTVANQGCVLASFTVGSKGQLTSTNTYADMPKVCGSAMQLSPSGQILAVLSYSGQDLQFFHFNRAEPITKFAETTISSGSLVNIAWDRANHLFAQDGMNGNLHVFTVTSSGVTEAAGSPYHPPFCGLDQDTGYTACAQTLIVHNLPPACTAPTANGVNVCTPGSGSSVTSPVSIKAAATVPDNIYRFELWSNGVKLATERDTNIMDESLTLAPGRYHLIFDARNSAGNHQYATRDITVK